MTILRVSNIYKSFRSLKVLDDVSFALSENEVVCILGPSGCGKTTLLNIIAKMIKPTSGKIETKLKIPGKDLGYMFQSNTLLPWRTVFENISLAGEFLNKNDVELIEEILEQTQLNEFKDFYPHQLSGGQQQRVAFARTIYLEPKLLIMDEPLSSLDVLRREELSKIIKNYVKNNNVGAIMITHNIEDALFLADRIYVLSNRPARILKEFIVDDKNKNSLFDDIVNLLKVRN